MTSTIAALAADLTSVAAPASWRALTLCHWVHWGRTWALALDLLLLDGAAVEGPPVDDGGSGFFTTAGAELELLG